MNPLIQALERHSGVPYDEGKVETQKGIMGKYRRSVSYSGDFRRIEGLPIREWTNYDLAKLKQDFYHIFGKGYMELRDIQAAALFDTLCCGGGFFPIGVGHGKSLISLLAPMVLCAERPILFVPPDLRKKTFGDIQEYSKDWELHPHLRVVGYSEISLAKNAEMLEELQPDVLIFDEVHSLKNPKSARTRRVVRYMKAYPDTKCVAMSGTISTRSLKDYAHIMFWCLKNNSPLPSSYYELADWADALDEYAEERSIGPGALMRFAKEGENARQAYRRRLHATPGVVATSDTEIGTSLVLRPFTMKIPPVITEAMNKMLATWETPFGDEISEAVALWRHCRELSLGFYYRWDPPGPPDWMEARRAWKSFVREKIKNSMYSHAPLDSELQVWHWARQQGNIEQWFNWEAIKHSFKPNPVPVWVDMFAVEAAAGWLYQKSKKPGIRSICWVESPVFGEMLSRYTGVSYFGAGDDSILTTDAPCIIASVSSHGQGKNLQRYNTNLIVSPMSSGKMWEQVLGRTHRFGQKADEVTATIFLHTGAMAGALEKAKGEAQYIEDTTGNRQKLNYATWIRR